MFKLKPGNVFQKLNSMDKKQAYTIGAIVIVLLVAFITLAAFVGNADENDSFEGFDGRGYDLAQMPFVNDAAEQYLLASKYPDMRGNGATLLYSEEEKEARQQEDEENGLSSGLDEADFENAAQDDGEFSAGRSGGRGYRGRGGAGSGGGKTAIGSLGSASMSRAGGSGVSATWGAPKGDFSPYKSQEKGSEIPAQLQNSNAKKALAQFARTSSAAARLREGRGRNAASALMGGNLHGDKDDVVDLANATGLAIDPEAPSTTDLSGLEDKVQEGADKADPNNPENQEDTLWDKIKEQIFTGLVNMAMNGLTNIMNRGIDNMFASMSANSASKSFGDNYIGSMAGATPKTCTDPSCQAAAKGLLGDKYDNWINGTNKDLTFQQYAKDTKISNSTMRSNAKQNGGSMPASMTTNEKGMFIGAPGADTYHNARSGARTDARNEVLGRASSYHSNNDYRNNNNNNGGGNSNNAACSGCWAAHPNDGATACASVCK